MAPAVNAPNGAVLAATLQLLLDTSADLTALLIKIGDGPRAAAAAARSVRAARALGLYPKEGKP